MNGVGIYLTALVDTGAEIELLINKKAAQRVATELQAPIIKKRTAIPLLDWQGQPSSTITHKVRGTMVLDGRQLTNQTFQIAPCSYDVFIGQKWLVKAGVWIHPATRSFAWLDDTLALAKFSPPLIIGPRSQGSQKVDPTT